MPGWSHAALPTGLQYDEIVRMMVGATPPPPGNFAADLAAIQSPVPVAATAAPRRHVGFGNLGALAGAAVTGNVGGAIAGAATDAVVGNVLDAQADRLLAATAGQFASALRGLTLGHVERHRFYAGWERVDDIAAQTATIRKCDLHQFIRLDLAKKTYSIIDPSAVPSDTPEPAPRSRGRSHDAPPSPEEPGTAIADFRTSVTPLGARSLDGLPATGYDDDTTFAMTQATGSCRNGTFGFHSRAYYSRLDTPRVVCPIDAQPPQRYPQQPVNLVASGGCRPTFTAHRSGPVPPAQNLSLYQTITWGAPAAATTPAPAGSPAPSFTFLTERGNVHSLSAADAGLFAVPADFTRVPGR